MKLQFTLLLVVVGVSQVLSRSAGPPVSSWRDRICNQMLPNHGSSAARSGNGGYTITTNIPRSMPSGYSYTAGQTYTGTSALLHLYAPINVMPHLPQVGPGWGHIGVLHQLISKVLTLGATL